MQFTKCTDNNCVLKTLIEFGDCFPDLVERVESLVTYSEKLSKYANTIVLSNDEDKIGMLAYYSNDKTKPAYIALIGVKEKYRGQGYGQKLLDYCIKTVRNENIKYIRLEVNNDNALAINFYLKNNFVFEKEANHDSRYLLLSIR